MCVHQAANWNMQSLPQLAVLGTSFRSLQSSSMLFTALTQTLEQPQHGKQVGLVMHSADG